MFSKVLEVNLPQLFESEAAYESAIHDYCVEHGRNPKCHWEDLDEIFRENDDFDEFTEYDPFEA